MVASKPLIALALLSGANALVAPQQRVLKTVMASTPVEETAEAAAPAPMTTLEAAVLEATGTEPAAVAPAPVAAPPVAPAAPPPAPKGRIAQKRTENWSDLALPFSGRPAILDRALAADSGFDPLALADSKVQLYVYREAELKHARLAMLAAAGWPLAELWDTGIAKTFGLEPIIEENGGRAVSVLNGGMGMISPVYWVSVVLFAGAIEAVSEYKKGQAKAADSQWMLTGSYVPGDLGFDPLGLYTIFGKSESGKMLMETVGLGAVYIFRSTPPLRRWRRDSPLTHAGRDQERPPRHARDHDLRFGGVHHEESRGPEQCLPLRAVLEDCREYHDVLAGSLLPISMNV